MRASVPTLSAAQATVASIDVGQLKIGPAKIGRLVVRNARFAMSAGRGELRNMRVTITLRLGDDPADAVAYLADSGVGRAVLDTISVRDTAAALAAVSDALAPHATAGGVHLDAAVLISSALRSLV